MRRSPPRRPHAAHTVPSLAHLRPLIRALDRRSGAKSVWMIVEYVAPSASAAQASADLGWIMWVYLLIAVLILTAKTISVVVLVKIRTKLQRGELNLTGVLIADPLLVAPPAPVVVGVVVG